MRTIWRVQASSGASTPNPLSGTGGGGGSGGGGEATHRNRGDDTEPAAVTSPQSLDNGDVTTPAG